MVLQDTWLNNGTIRDNIRYGRPDAADEEVEAAAKAAADGAKEPEIVEVKNPFEEEKAPAAKKTTTKKTTTRKTAAKKTTTKKTTAKSTKSEAKRS